MTDQNEVYIVIDETESLKESILKDLTSFSLLAFCIWLSKGSTFWTLFTGTMMIAFFTNQLAKALKTRLHKFQSIHLLKAWVDHEVKKEMLNGKK